MPSIIEDVVQEDEGPAYKIDETVLTVDALDFAHQQGIPNEAAVDKVLTHPDAYELHMKVGFVDPIQSVIIGDHKALKSGGGSRGDNSRFDGDTVTWWTSVRIDYGIGITDVVCIEQAVLDVGRRSGEHAGRYLTEYANIGVPVALSQHLLRRIAEASAFTVSYKKHSINERYTWLNMNVTDGLTYKLLEKAESVDGGDGYEEIILRPITTASLIGGEARMVSCNVFLTLGNSITLSRSMPLADVPGTTPSTVTTKVVACHVTKGEPQAKPGEIGRSKRL